MSFENLSMIVSGDSILLFLTAFVTEKELLNEEARHLRAPERRCVERPSMHAASPGVTANKLSGWQQLQEWLAAAAAHQQEWLAAAAAHQQEWLAAAAAHQQEWLAAAAAHQQEWLAAAAAHQHEWLAAAAAHQQEWLAAINACKRDQQRKARYTHGYKRW